MRRLLTPWFSLLISGCFLRLIDVVHANSEDLLHVLLQEVVFILCGAPCWLLISLFLQQWLSPNRLMRTLKIIGLTLIILDFLLIHYALVAGVSLGADLFAYSPAEIITTVRGADTSLSWLELVALCLSLLSYFLLNNFLSNTLHEHVPLRSRHGIGMALGLLCLSFCVVQITPRPTPAAQNKILFFIEDVLTQWNPLPHQSLALGKSDYPFAHPEKTPDTLSPLFNLDTTSPPQFIFIIVEGLGRDFSGPRARLGSFTPFLDTLISHSLYWDNFLSSQGRTFAVLPSVFGSLPFGPYGTQHIEHHSLLSILKQQGYHLQYFSGSNLEFDHQGDYLRSEGVDVLYSEHDFTSPQRKASEWGYPDRDLFELTSHQLMANNTAPLLSIVQTMSMHTPFLFPEIDEYRQKVIQRLDALQIPAKQRASYLQYRDIYASILYTDDALHRFFDRMATTPQWANTIVFITGDHRLPELPMDTKIERYHVPLLVYSPLLKAHPTIRSISTHLDIAPSVVAMLSHQYGWKTPATVSWVGTGLDTVDTFRNIHSVALKQTKSSLHDYVSGLFFLNEDHLYELTDNLEPTPTNDPTVQATLQNQLNTFKNALEPLDTATRLTPPEAAPVRIGYEDAQRTPHSTQASAQWDGLVVLDTQAQLKDAQHIDISGKVVNNASNTSALWVPLAVLSDDAGHELAEASGQAIRLEKQSSSTITLSLSTTAPLSSKTPYFVSLIVSDPNNGKPIGHSQYHVPLPH